MNNLSNERLKEIIQQCVVHGGDSDYEDMARELLALREAGKEPVAVPQEGKRWP